jgi:hypothetical protein
MAVVKVMQDENVSWGGTTTISFCDIFGTSCFANNFLLWRIKFIFILQLSSAEMAVSAAMRTF